MGQRRCRDARMHDDTVRVCSCVKRCFLLLAYQAYGTRVVFSLMKKRDEERTHLISRHHLIDGMGSCRRCHGPPGICSRRRNWNEWSPGSTIQRCARKGKLCCRSAVMRLYICWVFSPVIISKLHVHSPSTGSSGHREKRGKTQQESLCILPPTNAQQGWAFSWEHTMIFFCVCAAWDRRLCCCVWVRKMSKAKLFLLFTQQEIEQSRANSAHLKQVRGCRHPVSSPWDGCRWSRGRRRAQPPPRRRASSARIRSSPSTTSAASPPWATAAASPEPHQSTTHRTVPYLSCFSLASK